MENWVTEFKEAGRVTAIIDVIGCLKIMPIDLAVLKASSIGQTIGKLRKHTDTRLKQEASTLVESWKRIVDASIAKGEAVTAAKKKSADQTTMDESAAKKAKKVSSMSQRNEMACLLHRCKMCILSCTACIDPLELSWGQLAFALFVSLHQIAKIAFDHVPCAGARCESGGYRHSSDRSGVEVISA